MAFIERHFGSLGEMTSFIDTAPCLERHPSSVGGSESFTGTKSLEEARTLLRNGWPQGVDAMNRALSTLPKTNAHTETEFDSPSGGALSVPRLLSGSPRPYNRIDDDDERAPIINVFINNVAPAYYSAEDFRTRYARIFRAVRGLEKSGAALRITVGEAVWYDSDLYCFDVVVKGATQAFDARRLAFPCGHPSMLRRIAFAVNEREDRAGIGYKCSNHAYGRCARTEDLVKAIGPRRSQSTVILSVMDADSDAAVLRAVKYQTEKSGGKMIADPMPRR